MTRTLTLEPRTWLESALAVSERVIEKGRAGTLRAWILPSDNRDPGAVRRLVDTLLLSGVELHVAGADFVADQRAYPAGSIVIRRDQPYGSAATVPRTGRRSQDRRARTARPRQRR